MIWEGHDNNKETSGNTDWVTMASDVLPNSSPDTKLLSLFPLPEKTLDAHAT